MIRKKRKKVTLTKALSKPVQRLSPRTISATKNAIQQAKSKATLKALARFNPYNPKQGGTTASFGGREYSKQVNVRSSLKIGKRPVAIIKAEVNPRSSFKSRSRSGRTKLIKQLGRY